MIPKPDKDTTRKENYGLKFLINIGTKAPSKTQTKFMSTLKGSYIMIKWDLSLKCKHGSTYTNQ